MTPEYYSHLTDLREHSTERGMWSHVRVASLIAVLKRLDDVEKALADTRSITCVYCGHKTEGKDAEEMNLAIKTHILACKQRPERHMAEAIYSISITLGLELWEDFPKGDMEAIMEAVEKAMNARELAAFLRGLRAGNVVRGKDPDELPESPHAFARGLSVDSCAYCDHPSAHQIHLSSTGQATGGIFDVIDKAVSEFLADNEWSTKNYRPGVPINVVEEVGERIKLALQKASAEELQLRETSGSVAERIVRGLNFTLSEKDSNRTFASGYVKDSDLDFVIGNSSTGQTGGER